MRTGSLYHVADVLDDSPAKDDEWFTENIIVKGDTITVKVNDKQVGDWTQPADWTGGREGPGRKITGQARSRFRRTIRRARSTTRTSASSRSTDVAVTTAVDRGVQADTTEQPPDSAVRGRSCRGAVRYLLARRPGRAVRGRHRSARQHIPAAARPGRARRASNAHRHRHGDRQRADAPARPVGRRRVGPSQRAWPEPVAARHFRPRPGVGRHGDFRIASDGQHRRSDRGDRGALHRRQHSTVPVPGTRRRPRALALSLARNGIRDVPDVRRRHRVPDARPDARQAAGLPDCGGMRARHRRRLCDRPAGAGGELGDRGRGHLVSLAVRRGMVRSPRRVSRACGRSSSRRCSCS